MAQFLLFIQVIKSLIPIIREIVEALNSAFPEKGMGETKFQIALHSVTAALNTIEGAGSVVDKVSPLLEMFIRSAADGIKSLKPT